MRTTRLRLVAVVALVIVLGLAVFWLFLKRPAREAVSADVSVRPKHARAATLDRRRPEIRAEREFRLEEFLGYDPELAPWLSGSREKYSAAGLRSGESPRPSEQVASLPDGREGSGVR